LLANLPDVDASKVIGFLRKFKTGTDPKLDSPVKELHEWATRIENRLVKNATDSSGLMLKHGKVKATELRDIVDELQDAAEDAYGKESKFFETALKQAGRIARNSIVETAQKTGGADGKLYVDLMAKASEKRGILKFVQKQLGTHPDTMILRSESFVNRILGPNKSVAQARLQQLDQKFGTNFYERAQLAQQARQLGSNGAPGLLSNLKTGKASYGTGTGAAVGGAIGTFVAGPAGTIPGAAIGAAAGNIASSPRAGAMIIGTTDRVTGAIKQMFADPRAIDRIGKSGKYPIEIRRIAGEIMRGYNKDGPLSASGIVRLVADTPYAVGLLHAFDLETRSKQNEVAGRALQRMNKPQQEIATPQPNY
jgi:uncharacterized protein YbjQ (UPF0145 family)